jgi:hypothetical protein
MQPEEHPTRCSSVFCRWDAIDGADPGIQPRIPASSRRSRRPAENPGIQPQIQNLGIQPQIQAPRRIRTANEFAAVTPRCRPAPTVRAGLKVNASTTIPAGEASRRSRGFPQLLRRIRSLSRRAACHRFGTEIAGAAAYAHVRTMRNAGSSGTVLARKPFG